MKPKRGDLVCFWHAHRWREARIARVKGDDVVLYLDAHRVQIPMRRVRHWPHPGLLGRRLSGAAEASVLRVREAGERGEG